MNLKDLIDAARLETGDVAEPGRIPRSGWVRFANEAENEAARRARLLLDSTSPFTTVTWPGWTAGDADTVALDASIIFERRVQWVGQDRPLQRMSVRDMDAQRPGWQNETGLLPTHYVTGLGDQVLRPYPLPTVAGSFKLTVVRAPIEAMQDDEDTPEIPARFHARLVEWMKHRYFSLPDSEIYDAKNAERSLANFVEEFGDRSSARDEVFVAREYDQDGHEGVY